MDKEQALSEINKFFDNLPVDGYIFDKSEINSIFHDAYVEESGSYNDMRILMNNYMYDHSDDDSEHNSNMFSAIQSYLKYFCESDWNDDLLKNRNLLFERLGYGNKKYTCMHDLYEVVKEHLSELTNENLAKIINYPDYDDNDDKKKVSLAWLLYAYAAGFPTELIHKTYSYSYENHYDEICISGIKEIIESIDDTLCDSHENIIEYEDIINWLYDNMNDVMIKGKPDVDTAFMIFCGLINYVDLGKKKDDIKDFYLGLNIGMSTQFDMAGCMHNIDCYASAIIAYIICENWNTENDIPFSYVRKTIEFTIQNIDKPYEFISEMLTTMLTTDNTPVIDK